MLKIVAYCGLFLLKTVLVLFPLIIAAQIAILLVLFVPASKCTPVGIPQFSNGICNATIVPDVQFYGFHPLFVGIHRRPPDD